MSNLCASPKWKKPSDVMKKHRQKKRLSQHNVLVDKPPQQLSDIFSSNNAFLQTTKRRNPFSQEPKTESPSKRQRSTLSKDEDTSDGSNSLFTVLGFIEKKCEEDSPLQVETTRSKRISCGSPLDEDDSRSHFDFIEKFFNANNQAPKKIIESPHVKPQKPTGTTGVKCKVSPVDWSVKVKLRVISQKPLLWCTQMRTAEEACGITQYLTGADADKVEHETDKKSCFQSNSMYWIYPSLPWTKLFPRIVPDTKLRTSNVTLLEKEVQSALQSDWTESFTSAFHQLRAQHCPYFYLCTHQFSALFRASGMCGQKGISALLTPTTRGFREALKSEGISFSMPVMERRKNSTFTEKTESSSDTENIPEVSNKRDGEDADEYDDLIDNDEGASVWLESIGLDKKQFPSLDPQKVKIQREGFKVIDNRPESLVYVEGGEVQGLFNFLLNCKSCVAPTGPQAGVPPTILSPTAFKGATLKSHKVKHSVVKQMEEKSGGFKQMNILEVMGPILPHHLVNYSSQFSGTQEGLFSMTFNTHEPMVPFNTQVSKTDNYSVSSSDREKLRLNEDKYNVFFNGEQLSDRLCCIRELHCDDGSYSLVL